MVREFLLFISISSILMSARYHNAIARSTAISWRVHLTGSKLTYAIVSFVICHPPIVIHNFCYSRLTSRHKKDTSLNLITSNTDYMMIYDDVNVSYTRCEYEKASVSPKILNRGSEFLKENL